MGGRYHVRILSVCGKAIAEILRRQSPQLNRIAAYSPLQKNNKRHKR